MNDKAQYLKSALRHVTIVKKRDDVDHETAASQVGEMVICSCTYHKRDLRKFFFLISNRYQTVQQEFYFTFILNLPPPPPPPQPKILTTTA